MRGLHVLHVVGARPNFMKVAPVMEALRASEGMRQTLVHTGQHYDANLSDVIFQLLGLPEPDLNLGVGSGSHAHQTADIMKGFEAAISEHRPDLVLVYGDVNSTLAAALVCAKLHVPVGHVEAGLRSYDRCMPEEINRVLTDQLAELHFTPSEEAIDNLMAEGIPWSKIHFVGNVMIDSLLSLLPHASQANTIRPSGRYALVTLHRPSNVDEPQRLGQILGALIEISKEIPVIFPMHPRTRQRCQAFAVGVSDSKLHLLDPLPYDHFLALLRDATVVITDSGGIQEETTFLDVPCLTMRENTERPVTVTLGTNTLIGQDVERLKFEVSQILAGSGKKGRVPPLWDGHAADRIAKVIEGL